MGRASWGWGSKGGLVARWALGLALACVAWHPVDEADTFFHVILGRAVLEAGARVVPEPMAFRDFAAECPVPAWLYDVIAYGSVQALGPAGVGLLTLLLSVLLGWALCRLVEAAGVELGSPGWVWGAGLAAGAVAGRLEARPQTAFLLVLAAFLTLCLRYRDAAPERRGRLGGALVALAVVWAQLHGSALVAAPLYVAIAGPDSWAARADGARRRVDLAVLAGVLGAMVTGTAGLRVVDYVFEHTTADIALTVAEFARPRWSELRPFADPMLASLLGLWVLAPLGLRAGGRWRLGELAALLLGVVLFLKAVRFIGAAGVLAAPLSALGAQELWLALRDRGVVAEPLARAAPLALSAVLIAASGYAALAPGQPFGRLGFGEAIFPRASARYLKKHWPAGTRVLSDYNSGPPLVWWTDGHVRTYVDGRPGMFFDPTDFALARDAFGSAGALFRTAARYGAEVVVLARTMGACRPLAERWVPAIVEPRYTTFVAPGRAQPLRGLEPCGSRYVRPDACEGGGLAADLARVGGWLSAPFRRYLRGVQALRCAGDASRALKLLRAATPSWGFAGAERVAYASALLKAGRVDDGLTVLRQSLAAGDSDALSALAVADPSKLPTARLRPLLESVTTAMGDLTEPAVRLHLAQLCASQGDAECVRYQASRAALRGDPRARPFLRWLSERHPEPRARRDAQALLRQLPAQPGR